MVSSHDARMGASPSTLRIAGEVLVRCEGGALEVESNLFPAPVAAYARTTAGEARARLARSGLTPAIAKQALEAIEPETLASYGRGDDVRALLKLLTATEAFAGDVYDAGAMVYRGTWLDLPSLAADVGVQHASFVLQGLHLMSLLAEIKPSTPIELENGGDGRAARVAFLKPNAVISALRRLAPRTRRALANNLPRGDLARWLRDRETTAEPAARPRFAAIEEALASIDKPTSGRLSDVEAWTIEKQLASKDVRGARERIAAYAKAKGDDTPATRYLKAQLALLEGTEAPRAIAEQLLDERRGGAPFWELELLKARAWLAAGALTYARHFAKLLVDDPKVPDDVALGAHEVLEEVAARGYKSGAKSFRPGELPGAPITQRDGSPSSRPPQVVITDTTSITAQRIVLVPGSPLPPPPASDSTIDVHVDYEAPPSSTSLAAYAAGDAAPTEIILEADFTPEQRAQLDRGHETFRPPPIHAVPNEFRAPAPSSVPSEPPFPAAFPARPRDLGLYVSEEVESLPLPNGLHEAQLPEGMPARNADEVRIVSTRFARALAREYREVYGVRLRTDAMAIERMQRHLVTKWGATGLTTAEAIWDARRHGALLSEILARTLGGYWVDVTPTEIGYWAMFIPPRTRTWPFGRIYRFLTLGHREKDLVSYYLDLHARAHEEA